MPVLLRRTALAVLLAGVAILPSAAKSSAVAALHFYSSPRSTTITVELDSPVTPRTQNLDNPPRIVIDLEDTRIHLPGKGTRTFAVSDGLVRQIRVAQNTLKNARLVLDLEHDAFVTITPHKRPQRLDIEVRFKAGRFADDAPATAPTADRTAPVTAPASKPSVETATKPAVTAPVQKPPVVTNTKPGPEEATKPPAKAESATGPATTAPAAPRAEASNAEPPPSSGEQPAREPGPGDKLEKFLKNPPQPPRDNSIAKAAPPPAMAGTDPKPLPATANAGGGRSLTRALGLKLARVVIDAGHGGHDEGTRGPTGLLEKDLVLDVALRLGALVEQRLGAEVIYTRSTDVFVPLEERTAIANRAEADLFLSIHANSSPIKSISGSEVFFLSFATSKEALDLAGRENAGTSKSIHEMQDLLKKIALNEKVTESQEFGARVQRELYVTWNRLSGTTRNRGVKKAPFVVLIGAQMPSILSEVGFISNPHDEALLKRGDQRQKLAEALFRGVNAYASTLSHMEEPKATKRAAR